MPIFGIDASSFQRDVAWTATDAVTAFGAEKVTEGVTYTNPFWPAAKALMALRAKADGFIGIGYLFMDAGDGAAQADHFASAAGSLAGFGIAVDFERAPNGPPTLSQARACVARLRQHYPRHPIGMYGPHWFTADEALGFADWLWASNYVAASAQAPAELYGHVRDAQWAPYGGMTPALLQFTDGALVPGVAGRVDCSAFRGTQAQLREIVAGGTGGGHPVDHRKTGLFETTGAESWQDIARAHGKIGGAHLLRYNGGPDKPFTHEIAAYINAGRLDAPMPPGIKVRVPKHAG